VEVNATNQGTSPFRTFTKTSDFYNGDCDFVQVPIPPGGAVEASPGYACSGYASFDDCHLLVVHRPTKKLYEMYRANITGPSTAQFLGGCLAVWDLTVTYPPEGRGQDCSSADGAGFPIAPLLFNADEVAAGHIDHAIRFTLPNARIRADVYVHPATHSTDPTAGPPSSIPYGARLRLRADYPLASLPSEGARVIARALQKYGMFLSDGGNVALTAQSDQFTTAKWDDPAVLDGDTHALEQLRPTDFEMILAGDRFTYTGDCVRTTPLFYDGFEVLSPLTTKWNGKNP
jgi:serine/threonine-protein kinase